ncbi:MULTISPECIES: CDP-glycerol glycerophosphotransferase family protein [unclassified Modestobacter]
MKVVLNSFRGAYSDSPRTIFEALRERGDDLEVSWLAAPDRIGDFPAGVTTVELGSAEARAALESADVVVSNDHIGFDWDKRPGTTYLQTWHGTPLKRIHNDVLWAPEGRLAYLDTEIARWDALLSPNAVSTPRFRKAFGFTGPVHETGYPRNDLLSSPDRDRLRAEVRAELGIAEGVTAVLYTPTWRDDQVFGGNGGPQHTFPLDLGDFAHGLGEDHVLLLRLHQMVSDRLAVPGGAPVRDVSRYPDIRYLYLAADVLVTDYSSTMFDFAVTGKPILNFTYDLDYFQDTLRGFYFDLAEAAPGPLLSTSDEVLAAIAELARRPWEPTPRYTRFQEKFCSLEDGHATDRVLELFFPRTGHPGPSGTPTNDEPRR